MDGIKAFPEDNTADCEGEGGGHKRIVPQSTRRIIMFIPFTLECWNSWNCLIIIIIEIFT